jgi:hypothetical protein
MLNDEQLALLALIAGGGYQPAVQQEYNTLRALYRRRLIRYGWMAVEITELGIEALALLEQKEAS